MPLAPTPNNLPTDCFTHNNGDLAHTNHFRNYHPRSIDSYFSFHENFPSQTLQRTDCINFTTAAFYSPIHERHLGKILPPLLPTTVTFSRAEYNGDGLHYPGLPATGILKRCTTLLNEGGHICEAKPVEKLIESRSDPPNCRCFH